MHTKNKQNQKNPLEVGFHDLIFIDCEKKLNPKGTRVLFKFTLANNPKQLLFRSFNNIITPTNQLGQFIRMLLANNNLRLSVLKNPNEVLVPLINKMKGATYRAYITPNKTLTWYNIENIQLLKMGGEDA